MRDLEELYVPSYLARLLFDEVVEWEDVESLVSLLTMTMYRSPVEEHGPFRHYVIRRRDVAERFMETSRFREFKFERGGRRIGFVERYRFSNDGDKGRLLSYWVHEACHPRLFSRQHVLLGDGGYPERMWRIPRHMLIRWRYSERLPVHKSCMEPAVRFDGEVEEIGDDEGVVRAFDEITEIFFAMMCHCDESSLSYGFLCYAYYEMFDEILSGLRKGGVAEDLRRRVGMVLSILRVERMVMRHGNARPKELEGRWRGVLPKSVYNFYPFSKFSPVRARGVEEEVLMDA